MTTGLKKFLRDIMFYKGRTILTLAGVLIGMTAVGAVLSAYSILNREMNRNYMDINPASIVLNVRNLDDKAIQLVKSSYGTTEIEVRKTILARISKDDGTFGTIYLTALEDFEKQRVDTFTLEKGHFPVNASEMVLERDCLKILKNLKQGFGESVRIKLPGNEEKNIQLSGKVHAPGLPPASMENFSYAFLSLEGLRGLGYKGWYDEIRIVSYDNRFDREQMKTLSQDIKRTLADNGYAVTRVDVPEPGKHPHGGQLSSLLFLLQAFTVISLLVACIIIINLLNFIMSKQSKQIAIMKAVGASATDIAFPYFCYIFVISIAGLILSIPLSIAAGCGYSKFAAGVLNFNITSYSIPHWVFVVQAAVGVLIPLTSAAYPICKNCTKSVKDGLSEKIDSSTETDSKPTYVKLLLGTSSQIIMPINNLLRKRVRTILAILALTAGGTLFMTSQNIIASIDKTIDVSLQSFSWDYDIRLAQNYPEGELKDVLNSIGGIDKVEFWKGNSVLLKKQDGTDSAYYPIKLVPAETQMVKFLISDGLELKNDKNFIVVNKSLADDEKWIKPGMTTRIESGGKTAEVVIAGIVNEVPALPSVYMDLTTYEQLFGGTSKQIILAGAKTRDLKEQLEIAKNIEESFKSSGIEVAENWNIYIFKKSFVDHLRLIVTFLSAIAMLAVAVGGLSIASAIGINISERKREFGVLRAVGASRYQIISMISLEVFLLGIVGWLAGVILSYPVSIWVGNYFGQIFLHTDLQNVLSTMGSIKWLAISIAISLLSGFLPAWKAATAPLREMLTYE